MGSGQDHASIMEHNLPGLARIWIAAAYAHGHNFMVPDHLWCYTKEKGTHWYDGPAEEYAWLYQFVRNNARLLDEYEAVAPVAVIYDNAARRKGRGDVEPICVALAERNIPFTVVVAGDEWLDTYRLSTDGLRPYRAVIASAETNMDDAQRGALDHVADEGRLVTWPDDMALERLIARPVSVDGSEKVQVVVRHKPVSDASPVVVHLLNQAYDAETDEMIMQEDVTIRLSQELLGNRRFTKALLHSPRNDSQELTLASDQHALEVVVPRLDLWGIVELQR